MYYCYISHDKVNQLLSRFSEYDVDEHIEKKGNQNNYQGGITLSSLWKILGLNVSYGRSDLYHKELKLRENITQKLIRLLSLIKDDTYDLIQENINNSYFYFNGFLKVKEIDYENHMVIIEGKQEKYSLIFHCSLKYFSSNSDFEKPISINSSNYAFLRDKQEIEFKSVFLKIHKKENNIIGSPLFLLLENEDLNL